MDNIMNRHFTSERCYFILPTYPQSSALTTHGHALILTDYTEDSTTLLCHGSHITVKIKLMKTCKFAMIKNDVKNYVKQV